MIQKLVPPFSKVDEISAHHDVSYSRGVDKNECDRKLVAELDKIPYGELPKMGMFARKVLRKKKFKNLNEQLADELNKPILRKFKKRKVIVSNIDDISSANLVDMQQLKSYNHGFRYILNVIDVFSKFVWSVPIKDKTGRKITNTFQSIVKTSKRKPKILWVDNGFDFYNNIVKKWLLEKEIKMYSIFNEGKAVFIERFSRTIKCINILVLIMHINMPMYYQI